MIKIRCSKNNRKEAWESRAGTSAQRHGAGNPSIRGGRGDNTHQMSTLWTSSRDKGGCDGTDDDTKRENKTGNTPPEAGPETDVPFAQALGGAARRQRGKAAVKSGKGGVLKCCG